MRLIPPAFLIAVLSPLFSVACFSGKIIETIDPDAGVNRGDTSIINSDLLGPTIRLDGRIIQPRGGADTPPGPNCGNGELTSDEACDDGNNESGDGCANNCLNVEPGFSCVDPGKSCRPIARCGDGLVVFPEQCDDGNKEPGDGCSEICKIEIGFKCDGSPSKCTHTTCGDKKIEGAEGCDDGNSMPFDGCSSDCQNEPKCTGTGACTSRCGDGIVLNEECDDGNNIDGDGCSSECNNEKGFECKQPTLGEKMMVPVIYRDFKFQNPTDFEAGVTGQEAASKGMVKEDLDKDGKPEYANPASPGGGVHVASASSFSQWYRNTSGVNSATASKLALWNNGKDAYVNRYGENGEQWNVTDTADWCGQVGQELKDASGKAKPCTFQYESASNQTDCNKMQAQGYEMLRCFTDGTTYKATFIVKKVDGNPLFFPVDGDKFTPASELKEAQIPSRPEGFYDATGTWPNEVDEKGNKPKHNFSFTSEVRYWFKYESGKSYKLEFVGDDDVWVFINKKLALDIGGIHTPVQDSITLDATRAKKLGDLQSGNVYEIAVFQAERQTTCSSYKLTLSGFNAAPSNCTPICGDGILAIGEECDDGPNNGKSNGYGSCSATCTLGTFCGDGIRQEENGEDCDDGGNNGLPGYCPSGCRILYIP